MTISATPLKVSSEGGLIYEWPGDLHYAILSITDQGLSTNQETSLRERKSLLSAADRARYLQLPASLREPLKSYTLRLIGDERDPQRVAALLLEHFEKNFRYQLSQTPSAPDEDPIISFLTKSRAGHCEYFSSAMTLLLRSVGIPARQITGYAGGEWSELGAYYLVRNRDAHAWVEMWRGGSGEIADQRSWQRLDPTPPRQSVAEPATLLNRARKFRDHMQFLWFRYVLGFDSRDQVQAVNKTRKTVNDSLRELREAKIWSRLQRWWRERQLFWVLLCVIGGILAASRLPGAVCIPRSLYGGIVVTP